MVMCILCIQCILYSWSGLFRCRGFVVRSSSQRLCTCDNPFTCMTRCMHMRTHAYTTHQCAVAPPSRQEARHFCPNSLYFSSSFCRVNLPHLRTFDCPACILARGMCSTLRQDPLTTKLMSAGTSVPTVSALFQRLPHYSQTDGLKSDCVNVVRLCITVFSRQQSAKAITGKPCQARTCRPESQSQRPAMHTP